MRIDEGVKKHRGAEVLSLRKNYENLRKEKT